MNPVYLTLAILAVILMAGFFALMFVSRSEARLRELRSDWDNALHRNMTQIQQSMAQLSDSVSATLTDTRRAVQTDLKHSSLLLNDLQGRLGELAQASRQIHDIGKDIAGLEALLKAPKIRGGLGE